ncbi:Putative protein of unknown function [Podospora comata]|uniref:Pre-rRNA processing protein n=1 Tax=Podospora comata TaxID=48703 RepID=A0ABY6S745_PODCO|nr:Putative protein of unknown function [Podospora comata]
MSDSETTPFLAALSSPKAADPDARVMDEQSESTPLLSSSATRRYDGEGDDVRDETASVAAGETDAVSVKSTKDRSIPKPSLIAVIVLSLFALGIMIGAFFVPAAVEEYAKQAIVLEPTNLSLVSITTNGVRARIQANFRLDAQRVENEHVRRVGKAATWLVGSIGTEDTRINVYLPDYDNILLGSAAVPSMDVSIANGQNNAVDFVADLIPGDAEGIRTIANEWLEGRLDSVRVLGKADIQLRAGMIPLGTHSIAESLTFEGHDMPQLPAYNITRLNFKEIPVPERSTSHAERWAMGVEVTIKAFNEYPISVDIPELGFEILVPGCGTNDAPIVIASAITHRTSVKSRSEVAVDADGVVDKLPEPLTRACPNSNSSPLDLLFEKFLGNETTTVLVRGRQKPGGDTPAWLADVLSSITVPVPFPGRSFENMIRDFSLTDVHFKMPDPAAEPDNPESNPRVSGTILVIAGLPAEMNFSLNVTNVRANADVFYKKDKLGELNLKEWQQANSTQFPATDGGEATLKIQSRIVDAPLNVTDADVMTDVIAALLFGGKSVELDINALVDVQVQTVLGSIVVKGVPAEGKIPVKPLGKNLPGLAEPKVGNIEILDTTPDSISLRALVNITNPTPYTAHIPFISIRFEKNGTTLGEAQAENLDLGLGNNTNIPVFARWDPILGGKKDGPKVGRELISQYLSGYNTTITIRTHAGTIPSLPSLGASLSRLNFTLDAPKLSLPGKSEDDKTHFIRDATFHLWSSTAQFTLVSPLKKNMLYIEHVNATALYNHTEVIGTIEYDLPFAAPPGESKTPRLPVAWDLDSVGYDKVEEALGGRMKLDARAVVVVRLGRWRERVWYWGRGIGAAVRL